MDVVRVVRRKARGAKTGHAGTLDPLATGVLVVCIGRRATRLVPQLMAGAKRYTATIDFSATSQTDDAEGPLEPVEWSRETPVPRNEIEQVLHNEFTGEIMQAPPAHSAMKVGGRRAYKLARKGDAVKLEPRPVMIHSIDIVEYEWPRLVIDVRCGKGTYIRSLARDLGRALGGGAHLAALRRTAVGEYTIEQAVRLDDVPDPLEVSDLLPVPDGKAC